MKKALLRQFDRVARRVGRQSPTLNKARGDSFNVLEIAYLRAAYDSAVLYEEQFPTTSPFATDLDLISAAASRANLGGLFLEFGVASGRTIRHLAGLVPKVQLYGFDSFQGLPEDWRTDFGKGAFSGSLPPVPANVSLVQGWFNESLPEFLKTHEGNVSYLHVDCDLYSSTKCVFDLLSERIVSGTIIVFDEYWNYPGWRDHEFKAFEELKSSKGISCTPIGFVPSHQQVAFVVD